VNTGEFDLFPPLTRAARKVGAWAHVDGAFGLWPCSSSRRVLAEGLEDADSWTTDAAGSSRDREGSHCSRYPMLSATVASPDPGRSLIADAFVFQANLAYASSMTYDNPRRENEVRRRDVMIGGLALGAIPTGAIARPIQPILDFEHESGGQVGFHARDIGSGRALSWRAHERFLICSTFKASLAALTLHRVDVNQEGIGNRITLTSADVPDWHAPVAREHLARGYMTVGEMCDAAVRYSDNSCANMLLARAGGPPALTAFWRSLGDQVSRIDDAEPEVNRTTPGGLRNTTTPIAMAATLERMVLSNALSLSSLTLLRSWLVGNTTGDNRLRAGLPVGWVTGDKTGSNGADAAGDLAVTWPHADRPIVMVAYTRGGKPSPAQFDALFKALGQWAASMLI
jgi:beta-lactamase class A